MPDSKTPFVWMDGRLVPTAEATVHMLTHSLHYGLGVFEGTRAYKQTAGGSAIFRLDDHLWRLGRSANAVNIKLPFDLETLKQASLDIMEVNGLETCYLRHIAWIGAGVMGLHPKDNPIRCAILT